jgi:acyl-CoA carboxylase epsilon subunit-like protein
MGHGQADGELRVVRGGPTAEELAALLTAVRAAQRTGRQAGQAEERERYERWRAGRLTALRADPRHPTRFRTG